MHKAESKRHRVPLRMYRRKTFLEWAIPISLRATDHTLRVRQISVLFCLKIVDLIIKLKFAIIYKTEMQKKGGGNVVENIKRME